MMNHLRDLSGLPMLDRLRCWLGRHEFRVHRLDGFRDLIFCARYGCEWRRYGATRR